MMKALGVESEDQKRIPFVKIRHRKFVGICEAYLCRNKFYISTEYIGVPGQDILQRSMYPTEREIAHIIGQAC